jgi:hypothetical protein
MKKRFQYDKFSLYLQIRLRVDRFLDRPYFEVFEAQQVVPDLYFVLEGIFDFAEQTIEQRTLLMMVKWINFREEGVRAL